MDKILSMFFEAGRWEYAIAKGVGKDVPKNVLFQLCKPEVRMQMYEVTVIFGENAAQAYINDGVDGLCEFIDEGRLVRMTFDTLAERRAYISGINDADGWLGSAVLEDSDAESERVKALLDK